MYRISDYGDMIADQVRTQAYAEALRRCIRPGAVVADLGCGTGFFSLLACRLGARKVYAIETSPAALAARELASLNGLADRVVVLQRAAKQVELPERVDILLSDLRGILPLYGDNLLTLADAHNRWLAPGGISIPALDRLFVAAVHLPKFWSKLTTPWSEDNSGLDMSACRRYALNSWYRVHAEQEDLQTQAEQWAHVDYADLRSPNLRGTAKLTCQLAGVSHGLLHWFETTLFDDVGFSAAPGAGRRIYGQGFCPWPDPVPLNPGDHINLELRADLVGAEYIWTWNTSIEQTTDAGSAKRSFRQSTFQSQPLGPELLKVAAPDFVPTLNAQGQCLAWCLAQMTGSRSVVDLAADAFSRFPDQFGSLAEARQRLAELACRYS
jgi:type I protein arginine methyltransferase